VTTNNVLGVGFGPMALMHEECQAGGNTGYVLVAICTQDNLPKYKLIPICKAGVQYALAVVSDLYHIIATAGAGEPDRKTFMVALMQLLDNRQQTLCQLMLPKLKCAPDEFKFEETKRDRNVFSDMLTMPPANTKRLRQLSWTPTAGSLPTAH